MTDPYVFDVDTTPDGDQLKSIAIVSTSPTPPTVTLPGHRVIATHSRRETLYDWFRRTHFRKKRHYLWTFELLESS